MSAGYYARFVCRARLHWLSVLSPDCVSRTAFRPDGVFPPLTPARTGALGKRLGDRFSKQAGHEYASSPHKHPGGGGGCLILMKLKISNFAIFKQRR